MNELIEKNAKQLAEQWNKLPLAGAGALESLLFIRLADFEEREQKEKLLQRILILAKEQMTAPDTIKLRSYKKLEEAVEALLCHLTRTNGS